MVNGGHACMPPEPRRIVDYGARYACSNIIGANYKVQVNWNPIIIAGKFIGANLQRIISGTKKTVSWEGRCHCMENAQYMILLESPTHKTVDCS